MYDDRYKDQYTWEAVNSLRKHAKKITWNGLYPL